MSANISVWSQHDPHQYELLTNNCISRWEYFDPALPWEYSQNRKVFGSNQLVATVVIWYFSAVDFRLESISNWFRFFSIFYLGKCPWNSDISQIFLVVNTHLHRGFPEFLRIFYASLNRRYQADATQINADIFKYWERMNARGIL